MFAIKVIYHNGEEEFVCQVADSDKVALFPSRARAKEWADFLKMGADPDEWQSVNVVTYKRGGAETP